MFPTWLKDLAGDEGESLMDVKAGLNNLGLVYGGADLINSSLLNRPQ